ncbi:hypothetical protein ACFX5K_05125 [Rickettsiales bacterium LUAb2]
MNKVLIIVPCPTCGYNVSKDNKILYDGMFLICHNCGYGWYCNLPLASSPNKPKTSTQAIANSGAANNSKGSTNNYQKSDQSNSSKNNDYQRINNPISSGKVSPPSSYTPGNKLNSIKKQNDLEKYKNLTYTPSQHLNDDNNKALAKYTNQGNTKERNTNTVANSSDGNKTYTTSPEIINKYTKQEHPNNLNNNASDTANKYSKPTTSSHTNNNDVTNKTNSYAPNKNNSYNYHKDLQEQTKPSLTATNIANTDNTNKANEQTVGTSNSTQENLLNSNKLANDSYNNSSKEASKNLTTENIVQANTSVNKQPPINSLNQNSSSNSNNNLKPDNLTNNKPEAASAINNNTVAKTVTKNNNQQNDLTHNNHAELTTITNNNADLASIPAKQNEISHENNNTNKLEQSINNKKANHTSQKDNNSFLKSEANQLQNNNLASYTDNKSDKEDLNRDQARSINKDRLQQEANAYQNLVKELATQLPKNTSDTQEIKSGFTLKIPEDKPSKLKSNDNNAIDNLNFAAANMSSSNLKSSFSTDFDTSPRNSMNFNNGDLLKDEYNKYYNFDIPKENKPLSEHVNNIVDTGKDVLNNCKEGAQLLKRSIISTLIQPDKLLRFLAYSILLVAILSALIYGKYVQTKKIKANEIQNTSFNNKQVDLNNKYNINNKDNLNISSAAQLNNNDDKNIRSKGHANIVKNTDNTIAFQKTKNAELNVKAITDNIQSPDVKQNNNTQDTKGNIITDKFNSLLLKTREFKQNLYSKVKIYTNNASWAKDNTNNNVFTTSTTVENQDSNNSYLIRSLDVTFTSIEGKIVGHRIILVNQLVNPLTKVTLQVNVKDIPFNAYKSHVFINSKTKLD